METRIITREVDVMMQDAGYVQRREWMLYKVRPDHYPLNNCIGFDIGGFDESLVQRVIDRMVERHEILRTTFSVVDGVLKQVIYPAERFKVGLNHFDLRLIPEEDRMDSYEGRLTHFMNLPFNFEAGPLFRVLVFEKENNDVAIHIIFHHVISDEHSARILREELVAMYTGMVGDEAFRLPVGNLQYQAYTAYENGLLDEGKGEAHRLYWRERLAEGIPGLDLIDRDRWERHQAKYIKKAHIVLDRIGRLPFADGRFAASVIRRYELDDAGKLDFVFDPALFRRIGVYRDRSNTGLMALFIAGLLLAFKELSGQLKFAFEIPGLSRIRKEFNRTMGWLTSGGVCFFELEEGGGLWSNEGVAGLLRGIDEQLYLLARHCIYPCEAAADWDDLPVGSRMPVFFTLSYFNDLAGPAGGGIVSHVPAGAGTYQDIAFFVNYFNESAGLQVIYDNMLWRPEQIVALVYAQEASVRRMLDVLDQSTDPILC